MTKHDVPKEEKEEDRTEVKSLRTGLWKEEPAALMQEGPAGQVKVVKTEGNKQLGRFSAFLTWYCFGYTTAYINKFAFSPYASRHPRFSGVIQLTFPESLFCE